MTKRAVPALALVALLAGACGGTSSSKLAVENADSNHTLPPATNRGTLPPETSPTSGQTSTSVPSRSTTTAVVSGTPGNATSTTAGDTTGTAPPVGTTTVTQDDHGRTVTVRRGDTVVVQLRGSPDAPWTTPASSNSAVLSRTSTSPANGGVNATFHAVGAGTAAVTATSTPTTGSGPPAQDFRVTIVVQG